MAHPGVVIPPDYPTKSAGRCIWCGRKPPEVALKTEHMVPFSFGGHIVIPDACCKDCERNQSGYIGQCCDKMFRALRLHHGLPSRTPKAKRKKTIPVAFSDGPDTEEVPAEGAPGLVAFPILGLPGALVGREPTTDLDLRGVHSAFTEGDPGRAAALKEARGAEKAASSSKFLIPQFFQALAHIGHAYDASEQKENSDLLLPLIRGERPDLASYLIGGTPDVINVLPEPTPGRGIHQLIAMNVEANGVGYVAAQIRLFTYLRPLPPTYMVLMRPRLIPQGEQYFSFVCQKGSDAVHIETLLMGR